MPREETRPKVGPYTIDYTRQSRSYKFNIYRAKNEETGEECEVLVIPKKYILQNFDYISTLERIQRLNNPHVVKLGTVLRHSGDLYIFRPKVVGVDFFKFIIKTGKLDENSARNYFTQIVSAVSDCHAQDLCCNAMDESNIIFGDDNSVRKVGEPGVNQLTLSPYCIGNMDSLVYTQFVSPEEISNDINLSSHHKAIDCWKLGVILYILLSSKLPFESEQTLTCPILICRGEFRRSSRIKGEALELVRKLLDPNPVTRATIQDILNDPWYNNGVINRDESRVVAGAGGGAAAAATAESDILGRSSLFHPENELEDLANMASEEAGTSNSP